MYSSSKQVLFLFQTSFYSIGLKCLVTVSTIILLSLLVVYHALEIQVPYSLTLHCFGNAPYALSDVIIIYRDRDLLQFCLLFTISVTQDISYCVA